MTGVQTCSSDLFPSHDRGGVKWIRDTCGGSGGSGWLLTGNAGTTPGTNFIGTTDDKDLVFKRNNAQTGRLGVDYTVLGYGADGEASGAIAIGSGSLAGTTGTAVGDAASAPWLFSVSVGKGSSSYVNGVAIGYQATDNGGGVAIGAQAVSNNVGISIGANSSGGKYSIALGNGTTAADKQFAIHDSITHFRIPGYLPASFDTVATLNGTPQLQGVVGQDILSLNSSTNNQFVSLNAAQNIQVNTTKHIVTGKQIGRASCRERV